MNKNDPNMVRFIKIMKKFEVIIKEKDFSPSNHFRVRHAYEYFCLIILPFVFALPNFILLIYNPCLTYTGGLYLSLVSIYGFCCLFSYAHIITYSFVTWFCTRRYLNIHLIHVSIFYSLMGSTLGFYNLFSYDNSVWYFLMSLVCGIGTLVEYFICVFQRRHYYYCDDKKCTEVPSSPVCCFDEYEDLFSFFGVIFIICWMGFIVSPIILSPNLNYDGRDFTYCDDALI